MSAEPAPPATSAIAAGQAPQAHLLNFFGGYVLGREAGDRGVSTWTLIEVCRRVGIGEHAVRSTLNRMVGKGLLRRERTGRTTVYRLTPRSAAVLRDGARRIWEVGAVRAEGEGAGWTLLAFTLPAPAQRERHQLRSRLMWAGFGLLQAGLWIAPAPADVGALIGDPVLAPHLRIFDAIPHPPTDLPVLSRKIWDLGAVDERYREFITCWADVGPGKTQWGRLPGGPLELQLLLVGEWLGLLSADPRLPADCLPDDWPAAAAERIFRRACELLSSSATDVAEELIAAGRV